MADDLILKAIDEAAAAQGQVVALIGAAGKGHAVHGAGIVDVHDVAALGGAAGHFLCGGVLRQQVVHLGLNVLRAGGDVRLFDGQGGVVVRQGHIVQRADVFQIAVGIDAAAVIKVLVVEILDLAVGGYGRCGGSGRAALLPDQEKAGRDHAHGGQHGAQDAEQGFGVAFQRDTS